MAIIFTFVTVVLLSALFAQPSTAKDPLASYEVIYSWKELDYAYPNETVRQNYLTSNKFIRENNVVTGIKVTKDRVFLTVPRWRSGVPATLISLPYNREAVVQSEKHSVNGPSVEPFPSWEMNAMGDCRAFQYVQSMEIDQFNRMWVVDVGRVGIFETPDNTCPPKLVLVDLTTNKMVTSYTFPDNVVSYTSNFLNDIVVGCTSKDSCYAYISDAGDSKVVVFSLAELKSWYVQHPAMNIDQNATTIRLDDTNYTFETPVDGIALSTFDNKFQKLYFSPLSSYNVYSVPTNVLKAVGSSGAAGSQLRDEDVRDLGKKSSQTDGMTVDATGNLIYGLLGESAVNGWSTSDFALTPGNQLEMLRSDIDLQWPDTFAIDEYGYLFAVTNKLHRFSTDTYDFNTTNFRVVRTYLGVKSYMFSASDPVKQV